MSNYQGTAKKVLFVCTGGILRSATAAHLAHRIKGWNTRSCGTMDMAIPPVHRNLLEWADKIYCLERGHQYDIREKFDYEFDPKITVLGIPDSYRYRDPELERLLTQALEKE